MERAGDRERGARSTRREGAPWGGKGARVVRKRLDGRVGVREARGALKL